MIEIKNVKKNYGTKTAIDNISVNIKNGTVLGIVGSNGAGKSTLIRMMAGVYAPTSGEVLVDRQNVYKNGNVRERIAFVPDEPYFPIRATVESMGKMYISDRRTFNMDRYNELCQKFGLNQHDPISSLSKGQKRQVALLLALSLMPEYLIIDESFDGIDAYKRDVIKSIIFDDIVDRHMTTIVATHSLREIEDFCDHLVMVDHGVLLEEADIHELTKDLFKIQVVTHDDSVLEALNGKFNVLSSVTSGTVTCMIVRGNENDIYDFVASSAATTIEIVPLTLEELYSYRAVKK